MDESEYHYFYTCPCENGFLLDTITILNSCTMKTISLPCSACGFVKFNHKSIEKWMVEHG